jgi:hypothetical protein
MFLLALHPARSAEKIDIKRMVLNVLELNGIDLKTDIFGTAQTYDPSRRKPGPVSIPKVDAGQQQVYKR